MLSRIAVAVAALALLSGCPDPNTYGTPRTLAPGDFQLQAALGGWGGTASGNTHFSAGLPSLGVRYGLADRVDVGARVVNFTGLGGDTKINLVRGRFDLAVDPGVQAFHIIGTAMNNQTASPVEVLQFHVPLLLGYNFDEDRTLVLTPGFVATAVAGNVQVTGALPDQIAFATPGVGARLGLGLNIRTSDTFSWQPELTAYHEINAVDAWVYVFGIGGNIGAQPDYSDLAEGPGEGQTSPAEAP